MNKKYDIDMTEGPFLGKILRFALPLVFTGLLQMVYNTADIIVVGRFAGKEALAAVGATSSLINLVLNIVLGMSMGSGIMAARYIGARDDEKVRRCTHCAMALSIVSGIAVSVIGCTLSREFLILMNSPEDVLPLSTQYLRIYFFGATGSMVFNFGASIVRATGDTKRPLIILLGTGVVNVVLNIVLVKFFSMGVAGVAIATIFSQFLSAVFIVLRLVNMPNACKLTIRKIRFYGDELKKILFLGIPTGIQNSLFSLSNVIIQTTVNSFGSVAMAGITAGSNADSFIWVCTNAFAQTTMTFTSQNIGAKKYENLSAVYKRCIAIAAFIGIAMGAIGFFFRAPIVGIFSTDADVIEIGAQRLELIMPFYFFCSLMDVGAGQLRGMGKSIEPTLITLLGGCGLRLVWIFLIFPFNPTLINLYWAYPISWSITAIVHFITFFIEKRRLLKKANLNIATA